MSTIIKAVHQIPQFWKRQSIAQKATLLYLLILLLLILFVPVFSIRSISDDSIQTLWLFHAWIIKTCFLFLLYIGFLFAWNISVAWRNRCYVLFGFQGSQPLVTFIGLTMMLCYLLIVSDVILVVKEYLSSNIQLHWWFIVLVSALFVGMIRQLIVARLQWKQKISQQEISLHKHEYHQKDSFNSSDLTTKTLF
jgi:hypothetical protein